MNAETAKRFIEVKEDAEKFYKSIGEIYCPYLKTKVNFNAKGLEHIKFNGRSKARTLPDQYTRFRFIKFAPQILEASHTLQEYKNKRCFERIKENTRWDFKATDAEYFGFVAIVKTVRIKVIVKKIAGGKPYFWSVIPFWKTDHPILGEIKKVFFDGDPEEQ